MKISSHSVKSHDYVCGSEKHGTHVEGAESDHKKTIDCKMKATCKSAVGAGSRTKNVGA